MEASRASTMPSRVVSREDWLPALSVGFDYYCFWNGLLILFAQAKTVVGPLDRVKILFQTSSPQFAKYTGSWFGVVRAVRDINRQDGVRGLFQGHSATLLRIFPYGAIKFLAYEQIRSVVIPSAAEETPLRRFLSGSLAGMTSVFITYPLEVIRVRLAFETKREGKPSLRAICQSIYNEHPATTKPATSATAVLKAVEPSSGLINFYRGFFSHTCGNAPLCRHVIPHTRYRQRLAAIPGLGTVHNDQLPQRSRCATSPQVLGRADIWRYRWSGRTDICLSA